jgi:glycosyltransferase involved in cell wall biosynthesis
MTGLRIAMLTTFYPPYHFGGDALSVQRLADALARRGHSVTVVHDIDAYHALAPRDDRATAPSLTGVQVLGLRSVLGPASAVLTQQFGHPVMQGRRLRAVLRDGAFDVIWFHNISLLGGPGLLALGESLKVCEAHDHWLVCPTHSLWRHNRELCTGRQCLRCILHHRRPPQLWRYTNALGRRLGHVDAFIAKSEFSRRKHHEFGFAHPMDVVPNFLPDRPAPAEAPGPAPHDRPYFLFVGRLERLKGLDDVIPVFARYKDADLLVVGSGGHGDALRRQAAGIAGVRFVGHVPPDQLDRYYRDAIALISPSLGFETFGITLIEAFQSKTPVIARRTDAYPEIVDRCGGGVLFSKPEELAALMTRMQQDRPYRDALATAARAGYENYWSEDVVVEQYLATLRRAALRAGRPNVAATLEASCTT